MLTQKAYQCDDNGVFIEEVFCQESPLEPGVWLTPARATLDVPPSIPSDKQAVYDFVNAEWSLMDLPQAPVDASPKPFVQLKPDAKKLAVIGYAGSLMSACATAMDRITWADWNGNPVDPSMKQAWAAYRKLLIEIPSVDQDQAFFIRLQSLDAYPWPTQPALPPEAQ